MSQTYNFDQSRKLLHVDAKTFLKWLEKANIDPETLRDSYDTRQKLLTYEQIVMLADLHKRPRPPSPDEDEPKPPEITLATVAEQLTAIEQLITRCFADLQRDLANQEQRITSITQGSEANMKSPAAPPIRKPIATKKSTKKTKRGKSLPGNLVPLAAFRVEHGISEKAVEYALGNKKITVERGRWTRDNRNVMIALGKLGQHEFYGLFNERGSFQRCKDCPHAL